MSVFGIYAYFLAFFFPSFMANKGHGTRVKINIPRFNRTVSAAGLTKRHHDLNRFVVLAGNKIEEKCERMAV